MKAKTRDIKQIVRVVPLTKADDLDMDDWMKLSVDEKMASLERIRKVGFGLMGKEYPQRMDKNSIRKRKNHAAVSQ